MIPLNLKISGFLSYQDPVELDFRNFTLACISGQNGAGKSSLLDAITWALFGQARKRDESVINLQSDSCEVEYIFEYEEIVYRVVRTLARGKTTALELHIRESTSENDDPAWRPMTERTLRETQSRLEQVLRLDYDTFVNVSFFLQGKADQFAQQSPTRRKDILASILGLEIWEGYKAHSAELRFGLENNRNSLDGQLEEIEQELAEEEPRKAHLEQAVKELEAATSTRKLQETTLATARKVQASIDKQRELVSTLEGSLKRMEENQKITQERLADREGKGEEYAIIIERAGDIERGYTSWQVLQSELKRWNEIATRFFEEDKKRAPFLQEIGSEKARLEQEKDTLAKKRKALAEQVPSMDKISDDIKNAQKTVEETEKQLAQLSELQALAQHKRERLAEVRIFNETLKSEMETIKGRIDRLEDAAEGAACPLCGQELSEQHRESTLRSLQEEGRQKGNSYRDNVSEMTELSTHIKEMETKLTSLKTVETSHTAAAGLLAQLSERLALHQEQVEEWEKNGAPRLEEIDDALSKDNFALAARKKLAQVEKELSELGYDAVSHEKARKREIEEKGAEIEFRALELARSNQAILEDEIKSLKETLSKQQSEKEKQDDDYKKAAAFLDSISSGMLDLNETERTFMELQERENSLNQEVGAARQKVDVLGVLRERKTRLEKEREDLSIRIGHHKTLERAFGKDGIPALLIEQALPMIEMKANEILGRLSNDSMHLHFETQSRYKDDKRKDLRETLEIQVSDSSGERDYEMFSGGEAFRVNFAIRLALSEELANRKGARLQMLVIDEGFGSQDALGRQRLIEAINTVKGDFAKVLVITHLEELKDAFPTRIEVEKTEKGSTIQVI